MTLERFSRQIILPEINTEGQRRISAGRVLCIGAGGLGSPILLYLAAAGVGKIGVMDHDRVDLSNLQRQILFQTRDQGRAKVDAAQEKILALNPDIEVEAFAEQFTHLNAEAILANYDLVMDGSDNFETKFLANDAAYRRGIPLIYGAVSRFEGQTALFWGARGPCYRCLHPAPPKIRVQNCAEAGVLGSVVGVVGSLQANLALQFLISGGDPTHPLAPAVGQLSLIDLAGSWSMRSVQVSKQPDCPTCSVLPSQIVLHFTAPVCAQPLTISADELVGLLGMPSERILLLDVRELEEWNSGHLPGAVHWPLGLLENGKQPPLPKETTRTIAYCRSGMRSKKAATLLTQTGNSVSYSLSGGIEAWAGPLISV